MKGQAFEDSRILLVCLGGGFGATALFVLALSGGQPHHLEIATGCGFCSILSLGVAAAQLALALPPGRRRIIAWSLAALSLPVACAMVGALLWRR